MSRHARPMKIDFIFLSCHASYFRTYFTSSFPDVFSLLLPSTIFLQFSSLTRLYLKSGCILFLYIHSEGSSRSHSQFGQGEMMGKGVTMLLCFVIASAISAINNIVLKTINNIVFNNKSSFYHFYIKDFTFPLFLNIINLNLF
jgi:hypothetical protein